jgi:hypothetical protein
LAETQAVSASWSDFAAALSSDPNAKLGFGAVEQIREDARSARDRAAASTESIVSAMAAFRARPQVEPGRRDEAERAVA